MCTISPSANSSEICWKLATATVVLVLSALLRSRVTPHDHLRQHLSPLYIVFPFLPFSVVFPPLPFFNLALL